MVITLLPTVLSLTPAPRRMEDVGQLDSPSGTQALDSTGPRTLGSLPGMSLSVRPWDWPLETPQVFLRASGQVSKG